MRAAVDRREGVFHGQDRRHQATGGRRHGRVFRRAARRRHQAQPQPRRGVQELPPDARDPRQEHPSVRARRPARARRTASKPRRPRRRIA